MKYIIPFLSIVILISCKQQNSEVKLESKENDRTEVTPCIVNNFVLRDTTPIDRIAKEYESLPVMAYNGSSESQRIFLTEPEFNILKQSVKKLIYDPRSFVYADVLGKPLTTAELKKLVVKCDTIIMSSYDANGKELTERTWACDSVSVYKEINMIKFYESWFIINKTNLLEKEMLGYGVYFFDTHYKLYRPLFHVFKDSLSKEKAKNKLSFDN